MVARFPKRRERVHDAIAELLDGSLADDSYVSLDAVLKQEAGSKPQDGVDPTIVCVLERR